jgi:hypothetical protein
MSKPTVLLQLDGDSQASSFDAIVAADCGVTHLLRHSSVALDEVQSLVHGAIFTRGPGDLHQTAIFVGGRDVAQGEAILREVQATFFGPLRVSVMLDANGANTTAVAAVLCAAQHLDLANSEVVILAGTGSVGQRAARLLASRRSNVRIGSRNLDRAEAVCRHIREQNPDARLTPFVSDSEAAVATAIAGADAIIAAGAAGVQLAAWQTLASGRHLRVAIDLNAVPPAGIEAIEVTDRGVDRNGVVCYGAIGVGGAKMKIHKAAIRRLFESNDQVFDAEEIFELAAGLQIS